jgi:hypothetical protein
LIRSIGIVFVLLVSYSAIAAQDENCAYHEDGVKNVYWGDLHVHSAYSLDAWGYGTMRTPAEAYAFARGEPIKLAGSIPVQLDRPLDFMSVTDHAEWFNLLYICTDPEWSDDSYCKTMTENNNVAEGSKVFVEYVLPTITKAAPAPTPLCEKDAKHCKTAQQLQWQRIQHQTNAANDPCNFTSFNGFEWSATPDYSHNHRNIIFASDKVSHEAIDYMRFETPEKLWHELEKQCTPEDGCEAIAIPHNSNMGDGKSFDVEIESERALALRSKYETLIEIHQEKGNSECLPAFGSTDEDCSFERYLTKSSRATTPESYTAQEWETMRRGYVRGLLQRGLVAYDKSGNKKRNPLQLGVIGSTDGHAGTPGFVEENQWMGSVFGIGDLDKTMTRLSFNPGGLAAVRAEENTRASLFAALKRREVYATSGPRITLNFTSSSEILACNSEAATGNIIAMGGEFSSSPNPPYFKVEALYDRTPIASVEIIKAELVAGELVESNTRIWQADADGLSVCAVWQDSGFSASSPAFWYARVIEAPTPRWSAFHCQKAGRCDEFPEAQKTVRERAWSSPIWYLP